MNKVTKSQIVEIGVELRDVLPDPYDHEIFSALEDCIGRRPTDVEHRLALVAYDHGADAAKRTVWYA